MSTGEDWYKIAFDTTREQSFGCFYDECQGNSIKYNLRNKYNFFYCIYNNDTIYYAEFVYFSFNVNF